MRRFLSWLMTSEKDGVCVNDWLTEAERQDCDRERAPFAAYYKLALERKSNRDALRMLCRAALAGLAGIVAYLALGGAP
jgi:hypothetical protein